LERRHGIVRIVELGLLVASGMLTYAIGLQLLGVMDLRGVPAKVSARLRRRRAVSTDTPPGRDLL